MNRKLAAFLLSAIMAFGGALVGLLVGLGISNEYYASKAELKVKADDNQQGYLINECELTYNTECEFRAVPKEKAP